MAHTFLTSNYQNKAIRLLDLLVLTLSMMQTSEATEFAVGGTKRWSPDSTDYNQWAEKNRFQIGDSIVFDCSSGQDSVLVVNKDDYTKCNTDSPIQTYTDGHTVFHFNQSGPHYFISGCKENCLKNQKLIVIVMADRSVIRYSNETTTASPPPSGSTETTPPPAPAGEGFSSPPPGSAEINPTPAPTVETPPPPPPSGASTMLVSFIGYMGAFAASSVLLLVF